MNLKRRLDRLEAQLETLRPAADDGIHCTCPPGAYPVTDYREAIKPLVPREWGGTPGELQCCPGCGRPYAAQIVALLPPSPAASFDATEEEPPQAAP